MSKGGRGNNRSWKHDRDNRGPRDSRHDGGKYYYNTPMPEGRNDRERAEVIRHVSFKAGTSGRIGKARRNQADWDARLATAAAADEDVDMGSQGFSSAGRQRMNPYMGGRGRGRGRGGRGGRQSSPTPAAVSHRRTLQLVESPNSWYKVVIPHGSKYEKDYILTTLQNLIAPATFTPFLYKAFGGESSFYVDSHASAEALMLADRKATTSEGFKLLTRVRPGFPPTEPGTDTKERFKLAMAKRYNAANKALDLERFHMDASLREDMLAALFRPNIMLTAVDIMAENIPELCALNLADNRLHVIDHLSCLATKLPALTVLHLANNRIRDIRQLECLKQLKLVDLVLEGNPLCSKFRDNAVYVSEVTKRFPKLRKLDNVDLPPPILFDTGEEDSHVPAHNGSFLVSPDGRDFLRQFLEQYIRIYDSDSRSQLAEAYHERAVFSMAATLQGHKDTQNRLDSYLPLSRNLLRITESSRRHKLLMQGKTNIVAFLADMPKTLHDAQSFAVDMPIFTPQLIQVNVSGVFRERTTRNEPLRSFSRVFVIVPVGAGFCIINETMFVANVTEHQAKSAFKVAPPVQPELSVKDQMVQALCLQTRMNITWANKCLEETSWNFDLAVVSFQELNKVQAIPAEAFIN